ncbi:hypothetical protein IHN63_02830 [Deinococcus sp. 6YEL10]|uniref:hypothetical protein n=1 Tax=Deinococcus sp. 6YEL10 TaxID=2745870 RepID=UPI001E595676|nr:hypothetical protein [Deinococcus sp. 6YEL10]MCD0160234.1 hypothetical protein [Deinococcus sp. 6YEL10]
MDVITLDLHAKLQAALPGVSVLLPDEQPLPLQAAPLDDQGRPAVGVGERGLGAYLATRPEGYVQIEPPRPITGEEYWTPVAAVASSSTAASALAGRVREVIAGAPGEVSWYVLQQAPALTPLPGRAVMSRAVYATELLHGQLPPT